MFQQAKRQPNRGIILLVVLGMLSLFSVLVVSYVVFSSQMAETSFAANEKQRTDITPEPAFDNALIELLIGTDDPKSVTFGMSIMEDLWGTDGLVMRVGHRRPGAPAATPAVPPGGNAQGMLLRPLAAAKPQTTLFKFPTNRAPWDFDGASGTGAVTPFSSITPPLQDNLDDIFAGRIVTFVEGPLYGVSFRVVRSFGRGNSGPVEEQNLASCLVIDLAEMPTEEVTVGGATEALYLIAGTTPNRLLYHVGPDGEPGVAGFDDNSFGGPDDDAEIGAAGSDDIGYRFIMNGRPFNGAGQNPAGLAGIKRVSPSGATDFFDEFAHIELQPNARMMGAQVASGNSSTAAAFSYPQPDEPWDAADLENLFLAWQPSDHRRSLAAYDPTNFGIYSNAELNRQLGDHIIPSFHRPALINYLMNAPIWIPGDITDPSDAAYFERRFADMRPPSFDTTAPNNDDQRLAALITRLRRATMRPLNFEHMYFTPGRSDFNGDGEYYDGAPGFSGSNPTPIMNEIIQTDGSVSVTALYDQVERLATWLINGPWDVDNDNDGIPDSLFVDFNLQPVQAPDGRWIKPMIAPLIEDLDGKINVNVAGSYNQLLTQSFRSTNLVEYGVGADPDGEYFDVLASLGVFGRGGGVGPAEIDFSHLFDENTVYSVPFIGPLFRTQTSNPISNVLLTRYGNLMNARYGGQIYNYVTPYPPGSFTKYPGLGTVANAAINSDLLARIPFPARQNSHAAFSPMGQPVDMMGRSEQRIDRYGNRRFTNMDATANPAGRNEVVNTPYETGIDTPRGDDEPFTPDELHDFVNGGELAGRLSQLLGDAANQNEALRRLLTTESRSLDVPEVVGTHDIIHLIESKLSVAAASKQAHLDRMLAVELRKGSKLNLNRPLGNGVNDNLPDRNTDEAFETETQLVGTTNTTNNRRAREIAFPKIAGEYPSQATAIARYTATTLNQTDFDGVDTDGDGVLDQGTLINGRQSKVPSGNELLARHLYCLMFSLIADPGGSQLVPDFPYPNGFMQNPGALTAAQQDAIRNRYVARRLAQWAVNAVDFRDTDAKFTRLRYDPNPFDADGFSLSIAQRNVVWGMERPEVEITETLAVHDKRLKRNLEKEPDPMNPAKSLDGELQVDEDPDDTDGDAPDSDMDQFRIPEASAFVELHSLRSPVAGGGTGQPSYPPELYSSVSGVPRLNLGLVAGTGNLASPVYRLAVGQPTRGDRRRSTRWTYDADRIAELVKNPPAPAPTNPEKEIDYLDTPATVDWTDTAPMGDIDNALDDWNNAIRHAAEVRHSLSAANEFVTITDDDLDPTNDGASQHRIRLDRFVWFTKSLAPLPTLNVIANAASGMRQSNVYFNKNDLDDPAEVTDPDNAQPTLAPGQYAIVGPRQETRFGQTNAAALDPYPYSPVAHRLQFLDQSLAIPQFRLNLIDFTGTRLTPRYPQDDINAYDVTSVLPILCQSLYPHEVDPARTDWDNYYTTFNADEVVDMGFNISAPETGTDYYAAPEQRPSSTTGAYPLVDGYRDYDTMTGYNPDNPFDNGAATPLGNPANGWNAVGTHQEARTVFLQRLADPTSPWHPIDNPYLTLDFMPIDLTTINGEHDVRQTIDRDGDGTADQMVDAQSDGGGGTVPVTRYDGTNFDPLLKFDTRRKIPDVQRDRGISVLLANAASPGTNLGNYDRVVVAKRSAMSASMSILRQTPQVGGTTAEWTFSLGALWNNGNEDAAASALDTTYPTGRRLDPSNSVFRQTLGFVNREYGKPVRFDSPRVNSLGVGTPDEVYYSSVAWPDREFQSPLDLMNVPATSRTGMLTTFSSGTQLQDSDRREAPTEFDHLLGFDAGYANYRAADESRLDEPGPVSNSRDDLTGDRPGFEQIFDYVETGPVWFDSQRWIDPGKVTYLPGDPGVLSTRDNMFNRAVETLQPPFNYIGKHRTPGRINLNTMPDYVRPGGNYASTFPTPAATLDPEIRQRLIPDQFLDIGEFPLAPTIKYPNSLPTTFAAAAIGSNPNNSPVTGNGFTSEFAAAPLYGNGSVYRSLTWGISTAYELNATFGLPKTYGSPVVMGERNNYETTVDTRFGRSFKAFIESRRGYHSISRGTWYNGNPILDYRYPTRFAGVFGPAQASAVPSVQRFMRTERQDGNGLRRRTHDMTLLRPHPDFDIRTMWDADRNAHTTNTALAAPFPAGAEPFTIEVETDPTGAAVTLPTITAPPQEVTELKSPLVNMGLFERPQAELHQNFRNLNRDAFFRHQNAAKLANMTTHHSNVFLVRMTLSYFLVDPTTGSVSGEYVTDTGSNLRSKATYIIDRSIPVAFKRGMDVNTMNTVIYSSIEE